MQTLWNEADRARIVGRFERLSPTATPRWGSFTAPRMVTHVTDAIRASLGEVPVQMKNSPLKYWPLNALIIHVLPWPKGAPTAPELIARAPEQWQSEIGALTAAIGRFAERDINGPWATHAAFGAIDGKDWGRLTFRHLDHHLRQFGV